MTGKLIYNVLFPSSIIIINRQEANNHPEIVSYIQKSGEPYLTDALELGDFILMGLEENGTYVIERKSAKDFWSSIIDGRLWSQTKDMAKAKDHDYQALVLIELDQLGSLSYNKKTRRKQFVETALFKENELMFYSSQLGVAKWGVGIILTSSPEGTARFLVDQSKKLGQPKVKKEYPERLGFRKKMTKSQKRVYLLEAFGAKTAKCLFKHYEEIQGFYDKSIGTPEQIEKAIADWTLESGIRIGPAKAKEIYEVLYS